MAGRLSVLHSASKCRERAGSPGPMDVTKLRLGRSLITVSPSSATPVSTKSHAQDSALSLQLPRVST
eukprot:11187927-Lingulodinium_polyedra.AAC.1